jgi:hypothetical protein
MQATALQRRGSALMGSSRYLEVFFQPYCSPNSITTYERINLLMKIIDLWKQNKIQARILWHYAEKVLRKFSYQEE